MFDSHVHFDAEVFRGDLDAALARTRDAGVTGALNPAVDLASSRRVLEIHGEHPWVRPCLGIHPLYLGGSPEPPVDALRKLAGSGSFVAVGEAGLDFWHGRDDEPRQRAWFEAQVELAREFRLPLVLHLRKSFYEAFAVLRAAGFDSGGVCHAFSGSLDMARLALDHGFHLSAAASITHPRKGRLREVFTWVPRDRLLVETDAPDIPPWTRRGEVHRPWDLPVTVAALAEVLGISAEETAEITRENAERLFPQVGPATGARRVAGGITQR